MKKFTIAMMLGMAAATTTGIVLESTPAHGINLSFAGTFASPNTTVSALFTADGTSTVTIKSSSYAAGGFDPILTLFNATNGNYILDRDDISTGNLDFQLIQALPAGNYRAVISAVGNYPNGTNFATGFDGGGDFFGRTNKYAFDILNVNNTTSTAVPEPSSLIGTAVAGFTVVMFKRKLSSSKKK
jgi:hypothetical protein